MLMAVAAFAELHPKRFIETIADKTVDYRQDIKEAHHLGVLVILDAGASLRSNQTAFLKFKKKTLADRIEGGVSVEYSELPGMQSSAVVGHAGRFRAGRLFGRNVIAMQGRVHLYEGHSPAQVVMGVRLMLQVGARSLLVSNAAGGIRSDLTPGTLMLIEDHLNLTGQSCLRGPDDPALGPRFPDMSEAYDSQLRATAQRAAAGQNLQLASGVYAGLLGPSYETPAEIRMLRTLGADAVGMSTVLEVIAARHMGARVLGISCITMSSRICSVESESCVRTLRNASRAFALAGSTTDT